MVAEVVKDSSNFLSDEEKALLETQVHVACPQKPASGTGTILGVPTAVVAGTSYCVASGAMVLLNKHALASFGFASPNALLCFQCVMAVFLIKSTEVIGLVQLQPLKKGLVIAWLPCNILFVAMIATGFYALREMGIGMFSVWKNLANVLTACGDVMIFKKSYPWPVWGTLTLMIISAAVGASTDAHFSWTAYSWQFANCVLTAAYTLCLRGVMDTVSEHTTNKQRMDESSMVYYNNILSIPPTLLLMWAFNEFDGLTSQPALRNPMFVSVAMIGGLLGFGMSFTSLWFLSQTTATIFSLVGALNKIPLALVGLLAFAEPTNPKNLASIAIGLGAGVLFTRVKSK